MQININRSILIQRSANYDKDATLTRTNSTEFHYWREAEAEKNKKQTGRLKTTETALDNYVRCDHT